MTLDPLADLYYYQSPYVYAANDLIRYTDLFGMGPGDTKGVGQFVIKTVLEIGISLVAQKVDMVGLASDAMGSSSGQLLPNPDYDQLDLDMAELSIGIARENEVSLTDFVDVLYDVNGTLEEQGMNLIDAYLISSEDLANLAQGAITIDELVESKMEPSTVLSEIGAEGNEDKTEVVFYRQPEEKYTGKTFTENNVISTYGAEEEEKEDE